MALPLLALLLLTILLLRHQQLLSPSTCHATSAFHNSACADSPSLDKGNTEADTGVVSISPNGPPTPSPTSKIGKLTMLHGPENPTYERALLLHGPHNTNHAYRMDILRNPLLPGMWSKPAYILSVILAELAKPEPDRLRWLFWFDADVVIMNPLIPLEIFLPPEHRDPHWRNIHLLVTNDHRGLNNGCFFIRVSAHSASLLAAVLSMPHYWPDVPLKHADQTALGIALEGSGDFRRAALHVPQRWFNAFAGYRRNGINAAPVKYKANSVVEGDLLCHFAGNKKTRAETMAMWMDVAEGHLERWEKDVGETNYTREIEGFWEREAAREFQENERMAKMEENGEVAGRGRGGKETEEQAALRVLDEGKKKAVERVKGKEFEGEEAKNREEAEEKRSSDGKEDGKRKD